MRAWQAEPIAALLGAAPGPGPLFPAPAERQGSIFASPAWRPEPRVSDAGQAWRGYEATVMAPPVARAEAADDAVPEPAEHPLGVARGQVANTYIVAEAADGLVIVDQHAAHERLVLERLRAAGRPAREGSAPSQALLIPEVVELEETDCDRLEEAAPKLAEYGLALERFGPARCWSARCRRRSPRAIPKRWCATWPTILPRMATRCCWANGSISCWRRWPAMARSAPGVPCPSPK
jgi:DNA mismatch repair protein MutL